MAALWLPLAAAALMTLSACSDDDAAQKTTISCTNDDPCPIGQVCLRNAGVCGTADCQFCLAGQICYTAPDGSQSCSRPECYSNDDCTAPKTCSSNGLCEEASCNKREDCPDGQICNLASQCVDPPESCTSDADCPNGEICPDSGVCRSGCRGNGDCAEGKYCNANNACADGCRDSTSCSSEQTCSAENKCVCDSSKCPEGLSCDAEQNKCIEGAFDCRTQAGSCQPGTYCDNATGQCAPGCTDQAGMPNSCPENEVCNLTNGQCEVNNCIGKDPSECNGNIQTPYWNSTLCACVGCINDGQCDPGEACNSNGQCASCDTPCQSDQPGTCQGSTPYCLNGCCRECIGSADCTGGQVCVSGTCGAEPDCTNDPAICPQGWACEAGRCKQPTQNGAACNVNDPTSCPFGQTCQPTDQSGNGTCSAAGGGLGCGLCNADCTCDNGGTCDGFFCTCTDGSQCPPIDLGLGIPLPGICLSGICLDF